MTRRPCWWPFVDSGLLNHLSRRVQKILWGAPSFLAERTIGPERTGQCGAMSYFVSLPGDAFQTERLDGVARGGLSPSGFQVVRSTVFGHFYGLSLNGRLLGRLDMRSSILRGQNASLGRFGRFSGMVPCGSIHEISFRIGSCPDPVATAATESGHGF